MKIGTWDISQANARQWTAVFGNHQVTNESEWTRGSPAPVLMKNQINFKPLKVGIMVKGENREAIRDNCSLILSHLLSPVELELDGFSHGFCGVLKKHTVKESVMQRRHLLTLEFSGYEYAPRVIEQASGEQVIVSNPGNIITPAVVEITPQIGLASLSISGICRDAETGEDFPVTIKNLVTGKKIILDGETGLITEAGKIKVDIEIWGLPVLSPGENTITFSSSRVDTTIKYNPRFM